MMCAKKSNLALTREAILGAAIRLFQQHGFSGLGVRQIADRLHIKTPSLYHHFRSKEDLARQALQLHQEEQATRLLAVAIAADTNERFQMYANLFADILDDGNRPCMYLMLVREPSFREQACIEESQLFTNQNGDWLVGVLRHDKAPLSLLGGLAEYELAEMTFGTFKGSMVVPLVNAMPSAAFRARVNNVLTLVMNAPT